MDAEQYAEALRDRARHLYCVLMMDPVRVPLLNPKSADIYPPEMQRHCQIEFWTELVEELQIMKPEFE